MTEGEKEHKKDYTYVTIAVFCLTGLLFGYFEHGHTGDYTAIGAYALVHILVSFLFGYGISIPITYKKKHRHQRWQVATVAAYIFLILFWIGDI